MKHILILAALIALSAHATPGGESNNTGCKGKGNRNSPCKAPEQRQARQTTSVNTSTASSASVASGAVVANPTATASVAPGAVDMSGALIGNTVHVVPRTAPSTAAPAGSAPLTSCRLFAGLAGSNTGGSLGGGLPIGNDQVCLTSAQMALMDKLGGFEADDYLRAACKVEGMSEMSRCKSVPPVVARREVEAP